MRFQLHIVAVIASVIVAPAMSQPVAMELSPGTWEHATGDWNGLRPKLESRGITLEASLTADYSKNLMGGLNTAGSNTGHLFDASIELDTEKLGLWPGGSFFAMFICQGGDFVSADVGDLQVMDNIDADGRTELYELWYQQYLLKDALRIKVGKIDANTDFDAVDFAGDFIHSSPGFSPTILGFPTYPDPALGMQVFIQPSERFYLGLGIFDGAAQEGIPTGTRGPSTAFGPPADLFMIAEGGLRWHLGADRPGRFGAGIWRHTGTFDRFDGETEHGTCGLYLIADQSLWREGTRELGAFFQYGWADEHVSSISHHIGAGFALTGPIAGRDDDVLGCMLSCAILSDDAGFDNEMELAFEVFYKAQITPWLSIQPDLQYIVNPGGMSDVDDALALIVRVVVDL